MEDEKEVETGENEDTTEETVETEEVTEPTLEEKYSKLEADHKKTVAALLEKKEQLRNLKPKAEPETEAEDEAKEEDPLDKLSHAEAKKLLALAEKKIRKELAEKQAIASNDKVRPKMDGASAKRGYITRSGETAVPRNQAEEKLFQRLGLKKAS